MLEGAHRPSVAVRPLAEAHPRPQPEVKQDLKVQPAQVQRPSTVPQAAHCHRVAAGLAAAARLRAAGTLVVQLTIRAWAAKVRPAALPRVQLVLVARFK